MNEKNLRIYYSQVKGLCAVNVQTWPFMGDRSPNTAFHYTRRNAKPLFMQMMGSFTKIFNSFQGCITGTYHAHPKCEKFFVCVNDLLIAQSCAPGLVWNAEKSQCDFPSSVSCSDRRQIMSAAITEAKPDSSSMEANDEMPGKLSVGIPHPCFGIERGEAPETYPALCSVETAARSCPPLI